MVPNDMERTSPPASDLNRSWWNDRDKQEQQDENVRRLAKWGRDGWRTADAECLGRLAETAPGSEPPGVRRASSLPRFSRRRRGASRSAPRGPERVAERQRGDAADLRRDCGGSPAPHRG